MNKNTQAQKETLSDGSKVFNVQLESETIYCLSEEHAYRFMRDIQEAIERATGMKP
jgi:hypothetical protein